MHPDPLSGGACRHSHHHSPLPSHHHPGQRHQAGAKPTRHPSGPLPTLRRAGLAASLAASLLLGACASGPFGGGMGGSGGTSASSASGYGVVESVDLVNRNDSSLLGTLGGAVVGGILGNQVGEGRGRTAATVLGAAGGAYAGQRIEQAQRAKDQVYRIRIRLNDGALVTLAQDNNPNLRVGERVRVLNGTIEPA